MNEIFTKENLYSGQLAITRNGRKYIITEIADCSIVGIGEKVGSYYSIDRDCHEDLTNEYLDVFDIMKVYGRPKKDRYCTFPDIWNPEYRDLIWERKEVEFKEMTLSEVCEALGYEVKIVKEN